MSKWIKVCNLETIFPSTGVCALIDGKQVAIFRPSEESQVYAINNMDPFARSNVLSRGVICQHQEQLWVASPLKKQRFNLIDGSCLENSEVSVEAYKARITDGQVEIHL
ncbi:MAG: nitrite reductase small subunit NirD [Psychromonas sp.]|nr:nitrite reductase small subunit NirD [Alteromonadales bacterium]MCP5077485.1 nitrite reductase small subunit NirD [Psychromonas sp.]